MMEFMREGGVAMWVMLIAALAVSVLALTRKSEKRSLVFASGSALCVILGMAGMATGMAAVSAKYTLFPDHLAAVATGLGELSHNGMLGAVLALLLGIAALVTRRPQPSATA